MNVWLKLTMENFVYVLDAWRMWSCAVVCVWPRTNSDIIVSVFIWFCYLEWMIYGGKLLWSTDFENISSWRNDFGLVPHFCQQNKHIPLKKMIRRTTCKATNCFSIVARVKYSIVISHLHLHLHLLVLRWYNLHRHHTNQLARKVRRPYEDLKLYYDRFWSKNGPGMFHNSANNRESWSPKSDCVTLGKL